jgi:tetratricopeptide (TPR) repeat protein
MKINKITFNGVDQTSRQTGKPSEGLLKITESYLIGETTRGESKSHEIKLNVEDIIELVFDDGTTWFSNTNTLGDVFPEATRSLSRSGETRFEIPGYITAETTERGVIKNVALKALNILTRKKLKFDIKNLAAKLEEKQLDGKIGLFSLAPDFKLRDLSQVAGDKPFCLLIHGTASSISGSFGEAKGTATMKFLVKNYGDRILAFQHRTLTENPLQNARDLVKALPGNCILHLITTSRGGLVGEVLSRFCNPDENMSGFTNAELSILQKGYPYEYYASLRTLIKEIKEELSGKNIVIEKFIRIACPAGGTTLASKRLDILFNITFNLMGLGTGLPANPVFLAFRNLIGAVIDMKNKVDVLPGLEAQNPASPFIRVINGAADPDDPSGTVHIDNSLVVIAGNSKPGLKISALWIIASKLFFLRKNDLVVDTVSMSLGTRRSGRVQQFFYEETDIDHFKYFENKTTNNAILQALESNWGDKLPDFSETYIRLPEHRGDVDLNYEEIENPLLELDEHTNAPVHKSPIRISISQGDLFYASYPVMAGHFEEDGILYAEKQIDKNLDGALSQRHQLRLYPGTIGSSEVFLTNKPGFKGAIIIGLGKSGNLTASELTNTVEHGIVNYLLRLRNNKLSKQAPAGKNKTIGLSSLIVGCGYAGLSIENSIKAIIQGVYNANNDVRNLKLANTYVIEHIEFIELYEDKAISGLFSVNSIARDETSPYKIEIDEKGIKSLLGCKKRIPYDATEGWWNRISVTREEKDNKVKDNLNFRASTNSSREELQVLLTTPALMEGIIKEISTDNRWKDGHAKAIFELLIPNDFKDQLKRHGNIIWVVDPYTATYPWELLQDGIKDTRPICVSAGMVRQLATSDYRKIIKTVPKNNALIIADPKLYGFIGQLEGALKEGKMVSKKLEENGMLTTTSFQGNHSEIIEKLFRDGYKIIHLSGHGVFHEDPSKGSGMVIGKNLYLSTREINQMSTVPELVFVNCCHLGKTKGIAEELYQQRYKLAANIGTQLINNGVRCVIAAGWAVDDVAAVEFANVFYDRMFDGYTFGEAIKEARRIVYEKFGDVTNTWGAYQCYGDPFYKFENDLLTRKSHEKTYLCDLQAEVDLVNLLHEIDITELSPAEYLEKLGKISASVNNADIRTPKITETEALIYLELGDYDQACKKFGELLELEEATFSFSVKEKSCNAWAKKLMADFKRAPQNPQNRSKSLEDISKVIEDLEILIKWSPTSERYSLLGSTFKRRAFISEKEGKKEAYMNAAISYHKGYAKSKDWYPLTNWLILESILVRSGSGKWGPELKDEKDATGYKAPSNALKLLEKLKTAPSRSIKKMSYWDLVESLNIHLCIYILQFSGSGYQKEMDAILNEIKVLWEKAGSKGKRYAEIEHLDFIIDALSMVDNEDTVNLRRNLEKLRDEMGKMI